MSRASRKRIAPGVSIYRQYLTWWADVRRFGKRSSVNLKTHDEVEATKVFVRRTQAG